MKKIIASITILFSLLALSPAFAATGTTNCSFGATGTGSTQLCNPIPADDLLTFIMGMLKYIMALLAGIAVVALVIAGFRMVISAGNAEAVKKARSMAQWAIIGLVIAILSYSIVAIILNALINNA